MVLIIFNLEQKLLVKVLNVHCSLGNYNSATIGFNINNQFQSQSQILASLSS